MKDWDKLFTNITESTEEELVGRLLTMKTRNWMRELLDLNLERNMKIFGGRGMNIISPLTLQRKTIQLQVNIYIYIYIYRNI